jgi:hypothetical protein
MLSKNGRVAESEEIWTDRTFRHKTGSWQNFDITSLETLHMKNAIMNTAFLLVTHTAYFDTWFDRYGLLKSG